MLKEFKNVIVNYEGDALIKINDKQYKIPGCTYTDDCINAIFDKLCFF